MSEIQVSFVLTNGTEHESECSHSMRQAYETCKQLVDNTKWIKESDIIPANLKKFDYLIFDDFKGRDFKNLLETKCAILGPWAVSVCLMENKSIPSFQWPILNVSMYDCVVVCSHLPKPAREDIKEKVQLMGGLYMGHVSSKTTHLVTDSPKSEKYAFAAEQGLKLMLPSWIEYVWKASQSSNVNANNAEIIKKHRCPCFHKLKICTTGITNSKEKSELSELIAANGGEMVGKLSLKETDILICHGVAGTTSEKFKAARKVAHLYCVTINWVFDSVEKGYALPHDNYKVKATTSTPNKDGENLDPNFSTLSVIAGPNSTQRSEINETADIRSTFIGTPTSLKNNKRKASDDLVEKLDLKKIKSAGQFLDGCSIYVAGFDPEHRDKLNKIVNLSGATRYDQISDRVTHVVVGDITSQEVAYIKCLGLPCILVTLQWLLDSVEQKKPVNEEAYLVPNEINFENTKKNDKTDVGSPLSKKALNLLKTKSVITEHELDSSSTVVELVRDEPDELQQYIRPNAAEHEEDTLAMLLKNNENPSLKTTKDDGFTIKRPSIAKPAQTEFKPHSTSMQISEVYSEATEDATKITVFENLKFIICGLDEEYSEDVKDCIEQAGGAVVDNKFKGVPNYAIVPMFNRTRLTSAAEKEVNELWVAQCIDDAILCDILYYHCPMILRETKPLVDCTVTITTYSGQERQFLRELIEALGGVSQDQFSRKVIENKNVLASTHLISPEPSGKKYEAAIKWCLPAVTKDWLLECANTGLRADEAKYLVGESKLQDTASTSSLQERVFEKKTPVTKQPSVSSAAVVTTPITKKREEAAAEKTPLNQVYKLVTTETPETYSQVTPINKIVQDAIDNNLMPVPSPKTYFPWDPKTPDTPLGAFIRPDPSPRLRKEMQKYINHFPDFEPPKRRMSTPLSELRRRLRDKVLGRGMYASDEDASCSTQPSQNPATGGAAQIDDRLQCLSFEEGSSEEVKSAPTDSAIDHKLQQFQEMLLASATGSGARRSSRTFESTNMLGSVTPKNDVQSQVCTVGWDYGEGTPQVEQHRIFMISGLEAAARDKISRQLRDLGATVSESHSYDSSCTHLVCPKPGRNEKTLACMAAGKWILHVSYVDKCVKEKEFVDEQVFEFGNPKASENIPQDPKDPLTGSICYWRTEINRRGYGAFNDMRAIVTAEKRDPIVKVIEAGGGVIVNVEPPFEDTIHATHCLLEMRMIKNPSLYVPLVHQGIKCYNTIYIDHFLRRTLRDPNEFILPELKKYYQENDD